MALLGNTVRALYVFPSCSLRFFGVNERDLRQRAAEKLHDAVLRRRLAAQRQQQRHLKLQQLKQQQHLGHQTMRPDVFIVEKVPASQR